MTHEYFSLLGLAPGRHDPGVLARSFEDRRRNLLAALAHPGSRQAAARQLDQLYRAYAALRSASRSDRSDVFASHPQEPDSPDRADTLRAYIADSLEDGLLRYSRRQEILSFARRLGIADFHTQLLIAEVQFGLPSPGLAPHITAAQPARRRAWPFITATLLLASALFLALHNVLS